MSATSSTSQPAAMGASSVEVDASCRIPVLLLFVSAALWLAAGSVLGLIASLNFHKPTMFAECAVFTYGRIHPAATNAFIYGFAIPAGLGVLLWITCQIGRSRLMNPTLAVVGWLLWNAGVTAGILGIFYGESTGHEWLELPRYASVPMLTGYLAIGLAAMLTFHARVDRHLQLSQWFILAALFWFPWVYSTANLLTQFWPVRGTLQAVVDGWYAHNLTGVWFPFVGLAVLFYLGPVIAKKPIHSPYSGLFAFWTLLLFGSWGGIAIGAPVPSWIPALGGAAAIITIAPIFAATTNVLQTLAGGDCDSDSKAPPLFLAFAPILFLLAGLMGVASTTAAISVVTNFTWFIPAQQQLLLYGFFAMTIFGAVYHIAPRLLQVDFPWHNAGRWQFRISVLGLMAYVIPLTIAGILQGRMMNDPQIQFIDIVASNLVWLRYSTLGEVLMIVGNFIFLVNLGRLLWCIGRSSLKVALAANLKPVGVTS